MSVNGTTPFEMHSANTDKPRGVSPPRPEPRGSSPLRRTSNDPDDPIGSRGSLSRAASKRLHMNITSKRKNKDNLDVPVNDEDKEFKKQHGVTMARERELLKDFRNLLVEKGLMKPNYDKFMVRRFLRARNHNLEKALEMWRDHMEFRKQYSVDTILQDFNFHEREAFLASYPQGYHKTDKMGRPIYIQHVGQVNLKDILNITTEERLIKFHIQEYERCLKYIMPACSKVAGKQIEQTFAILDVKGVGLKHFSGDVKKLMAKLTSLDQNNYPESLGRTMIINAPSVFKLIFAAVKPMLDSKTQAKIEVCSSDYTAALLKWVDKENLPEYLGGVSQGTLLDDIGPWHDQRLIQEIEQDMIKREKGLLDSYDDLSHITATAGSLDAPSMTIPSAFQNAALSGVPEDPSSPATDASSVTVANYPSSSLPGDGYTSADAMVRRFSTTSYASTDDEAFYSPRSVDSGRFSFTSDHTSSSRRHPQQPEADPLAGPEDGLARSNPIYDLADSPQPHAKPGLEGVSDGAGSVQFDSSQHEGSEPSARPGTHPISLPILARVQKLEESIPLIKQGLGEQLLAGGGRPPAERLGQGTLITRVETLEFTVDFLLRAQEAAALEADQRRKKKEAERCCCACCSIM